MKNTINNIVNFTTSPKTKAFGSRALNVAIVGTAYACAAVATTAKGIGTVTGAVAKELAERAEAMQPPKEAIALKPSEVANPYTGKVLPVSQTCVLWFAKPDGLEWTIVVRENGQTITSKVFRLDEAHAQVKAWERKLGVRHFSF